MSATDHPFVVLPTYNERENITDIISGIFSQDKRIQVIVVDDSSPDKTAESVEKLKKDYPKKLHLIVRKKRGRGSAVLKGFSEAIKKNATCVIEMDADFSHNPKYIPLFLKEIQKEQVVVGSRLMQGGAIQERDKLRNFLSWAINSFIRLYLRLDVHDASGGFRCYRVEVLKKLDFKKVISNNYSMCPEMLYRIHKLGIKCKEIPIIFVNRKAGKSKANLHIALDYLYSILKLRFS